MILRTILAACCVLLASCSGWETKKITTEDFFNQEWTTIDITEVDVYPSFQQCDSLSEKVALKRCFEEYITNTLYTELSHHTIVVKEAIDDTVWIDYIVNEKGKFCLDSIYNTPLIRNEIPKLPLWIHEATQALPISYPATKRGIPVKTKCRIPIVLKVN